MNRYLAFMRAQHLTEILLRADSYYFCENITRTEFYDGNAITSLELLAEAMGYRVEKVEQEEKTESANG